MKIKLINATVDALIHLEVIKESEKELYCFGFNQLFLFLLNIGTSILLGILCDMLWQSILFSATYIPLRSYAGGYHAKTSGRCYYLSVLLIVCMLWVIKYVPWGNLGIWTTLLLAAAVIFIKAPSASENKPLTDAEKICYRRKARIILLIEIRVLSCI